MMYNIWRCACYAISASVHGVHDVQYAEVYGPLLISLAKAHSLLHGWPGRLQLDCLSCI